MPRETIILDLLTGDPQGLRKASFHQSWTGQAFAAPRTELKELLAKREMESPGIYVLHGETNADEPVAYIGVGKSLRSRLKNRREEFWTQAVAFLGADGSLHEGHIKFLEGKLIEEARQVGRFEIINEQASGSPLPDYESAAMDVFLQRMRILLPVLGCNVLVPTIPGTAGDIFTCKIKDLTAHGLRSPQGFVVLKGSQATLQLRPSAAKHGDWLVRLRKKLKETGTLITQGEHLFFTKDFEFNSPSAAAAIVRGGNANGLTEWRNEDGQTLKQIENIT